MEFGEVVCSTTESASYFGKKNLVQLTVKVGILKCTGKIKKCVVDTMSDLVWKVKRRAMDPLHRKMTSKMDEGCGRILKMKK
jgi:hypothetical protein